MTAPTPGPSPSWSAILCRAGFKLVQSVTPDISANGIYNGVCSVAKKSLLLPGVKQAASLTRAIVNPIVEKVSKSVEIVSESYIVGSIVFTLGAKITSVAATALAAPLANLAPGAPVANDRCANSLATWCAQVYGEGSFAGQCTGPLASGAASLITGFTSSIASNSIDAVTTVASYATSIASNLPLVVPVVQTVASVASPVISTVAATMGYFPMTTAGLIAYAVFRVCKSERMASFVKSIKTELTNEITENGLEDGFRARLDTFRRTNPTPTIDVIANTFGEDILNHPHWMRHVPEFCASTECLTSLMNSSSNSDKTHQKLVAKNILEHETVLSTYLANATPSANETHAVCKFFNLLARTDPTQIPKILKKLDQLPPASPIRNNARFLIPFINLAPQDLKEDVAKQILTFQQITTSATILPAVKEKFLIDLAEKNPSAVSQIVSCGSALTPPSNLDFYVNLTKNIPRDDNLADTRSKIACTIYNAVSTLIAQPANHNALVQLMNNLPEFAEYLINRGSIPQELLTSNSVMLSLAKINPAKAWELAKNTWLVNDREFVKTCLINAPKLYKEIPSASEPDEQWLIEVVKAQPQLLEHMGLHKKIKDPKFILNLIEKSENPELINYAPPALLQESFLLDATKINAKILTQPRVKQVFASKLTTPDFAKQLIDKNAQALHYLPKGVKTKPFLMSIMTNLVGMNRSDVIQAIAQDQDSLDHINAGLFSPSQRAIAIESNPTLLLEKLDPTSEEFKEIVITAATNNPELFKILSLDRISDAILIDAIIANQKHNSSRLTSRTPDLFSILCTRIELTHGTPSSKRLSDIFSRNTRFLIGMAVYHPIVLEAPSNKVPHLTTEDRSFMSVVAKENIRTLNYLSDALKRDAILFADLAKSHGNKVYDYADESIDPRYFPGLRRLF